MSNRHPVTRQATKVLAEVLSAIRRALEAVDRDDVDGARRELADVEGLIIGVGAEATDEDLLNDQFVLGRLLEIYRKYVDWWGLVFAGSYGDSWGKLQDAIAALRDVKRFSRINVEAIEAHLLQFESVYPYKVFASMGAVVPRWNCSICGEDIDTLQCPHRKGHLYAGEVAHGIADEIRRIDHVSLVENPADRMCIVGEYNDTDDFPVIEYVRRQIQDGKLRPTQVEGFEHSKRRERNPEVPKQGRNDRCACGSGDKYKKCCGPNAVVEIPHVELIPVRRGPDALAPSLF